MRAVLTLSAIVLLISTSAADAQVSRVPQPRSAGAARRASVFVHVDGGLGLPGPNFDYETTVPDNAEDAVYRVGLSLPASLVIDAGVWALITPRFGIGASVSNRQRTGSGAIDGESPHPFFFDQPRAIQGDVSGLDTRETAVHLEIVVPLRVAAFTAAIFGGPSFIAVQHGVLDSVIYDDEYPYDTATFVSATTRAVQERGVGYNVGADASMMLTSRVGLGGRVRYIGGAVDLPTGADPIPFKISSLQVTAGLRLAF